MINTYKISHSFNNMIAHHPKHIHNKNTNRLERETGFDPNNKRSPIENMLAVKLRGRGTELGFECVCRDFVKSGEWLQLS
ncbi:hypothetical protein HanPI659440_Chr16g0629071 [Helianthus annuus]|nr:hypothetical protein HanPI659440_Chr16g0629071 [Helianthus annuus]